METTLNVPSISCGHCERTIREAVAPLQGVRAVEVDIAERRVHLVYDDKRALVAALDALDSEGYPAVTDEPVESQADDGEECELALVEARGSGGCACCGPA